MLETNETYSTGTGIEIIGSGYATGKDESREANAMSKGRD